MGVTHTEKDEGMHIFATFKASMSHWVSDSCIVIVVVLISFYFETMHVLV